MLVLATRPPWSESSTGDLTPLVSVDIDATLNSKDRKIVGLGRVHVQDGKHFEALGHSRY